MKTTETQSRTEKSALNVIFALGSQLITTILSFVSRTVMLRTIGLEAISINGLFTEVIAALSLAELGIGSAIVYNLYKPLAEHDEQKICQLMTLYRSIYRIIAVVTFVIGLILCPFIQLLVKDIGLDIWYLRLVYMLFVLQLSASYLCTYKVSLLNADQNRHVYSLVSTIVKTAGTIVSIIVLLLTCNYIIYLILNIAITLSTNIAVSMYVDRTYHYLKIDKSLPKEDKKIIFDNVKNIFVKQVSGKITNSTDNILISVLVSTIYVGYYSFYAVILSTFRTLIDQIDYSVTHSMGNLFAGDDNKKCRVVLNRLTWLFGIMAIPISTCTFVCLKPFITLWVGKEYVLANNIACILSINLFLYIVCIPIYEAMHLSGFFVEGRNISILGSTVNLILSIILGMKIGMLGIFIGTFFTYLIQIILKVRDVYRIRFRMGSWEHTQLWVILSVDVICSMGITWLICMQIHFEPTILQFLINGLIGCVVSGIIIFLSSFHRDEWTYFLELMHRAKGKIKRH